jgi:hypothetical protein
MRFALVGATMLICAGNAQAWEYTAVEDAMTDEKTAVLAVTKDSGMSSLGVGFKCWRNGETQIRIITMSPYIEPKLPIDRFVTIKVRIDKNEPIDLIMMKDNAKGRMTYVFAQSAKDPDDDFMTLLSQLGPGKDRIAVAVESSIQVVPTGSSKQVGKFLEYCNIKLSAKK